MKIPITFGDIAHREHTAKVTPLGISMIAAYAYKKFKDQIKIDIFKSADKFINHVENDFDFQSEFPFNQIYLWLEQNSCEECIEYVVSIMMEPYNDITEPLVSSMSSEEEKYFNIPTNRTIKELRKIGFIT